MFKKDYKPFALNENVEKSIEKIKQIIPSVVYSKKKYFKTKIKKLYPLLPTDKLSCTPCICSIVLIVLLHCKY